MEEKIIPKNEYKIYTGLWDKSSTETKQPFISLFNDEKEAGEFHRTYFQWYNIIHELGHILREYYCIDIDWDKKGASEEQAVNNFAMAYWKKFGQQCKLEFIMSRIEKIVKIIPNPVPEDIGFLDYFNAYFQESQTPELYTFLQFTCVKKAYNSDETLCDVLNSFGIANSDVEAKEKVYTDDYHPQSIIDDACEILQEMGVSTPKVEVVLLDNALMHYAQKL